MRSAAEIKFRLRQHAADFLFYLRPPAPKLTAPWPLPLPDEAYPPSGLDPDPALVESILAHRLPLLGLTIDTGAEIRWRKDYVHGQETGPDYFWRVPYLDFAHVGDHKMIWELNRHQHLVVLARAWKQSRDARAIAEISAQLESWLAQNPFHRGINWASALEVAFRALSWIWVWQWAGPDLLPHLAPRFLTALWQHGLHLEYNLSYYFSPNTHLFGEALALHAIGVLFPSWPRAKRWRNLGRQVVLDCAATQLREDGSYFEQSTYYHVYAVDFILFHHALDPLPPAAMDRLRSAAEFLDAVLGPQRRLPFLGDDDGGRLFHPYGQRDKFGVETLDAARRLFPALASKAALQWFAGTGLAVIQDGPVHIIFDCGPFGSGSAGHSHSDALSLVVRVGAKDILIDPGTYTYIADPAQRQLFRSSAAHNTIRIDALDQARPAGPFRWVDRAEVTPLARTETPSSIAIDGEVRYNGFTHRRRVLYDRDRRQLNIQDTISGPGGRHRVEQFWHFGSDDAARRLQVDPAPGLALTGYPEAAWRSRALRQKENAPCVVFSGAAELPLTLRSRISLTEL